MTNRFCGIIDNHWPTCTWKEAVLSVEVPGTTWETVLSVKVPGMTCLWLQMSPRRCGGAVYPPDVPLPKSRTIFSTSRMLP
jgi:hypothetical protein